MHFLSAPVYITSWFVSEGFHTSCNPLTGNLNFVDISIFNFCSWNAISCLQIMAFSGHKSIQTVEVLHLASPNSVLCDVTNNGGEGHKFGHFCVVAVVNILYFFSCYQRTIPSQNSNEDQFIPYHLPETSAIMPSILVLSVLKTSKLENYHILLLPLETIWLCFFLRSCLQSESTLRFLLPLKQKHFWG